MISTQEYARIKLIRTPQGEPTCCADIDDPEQICIAFGSRKLGTQEVCMLEPSKIIKRAENREGEFDLGYTIPNSTCPFWAARHLDYSEFAPLH